MHGYPEAQTGCLSFFSVRKGCLFLTVYLKLGNRTDLLVPLHIWFTYKYCKNVNQIKIAENLAGYSTLASTRCRDVARPKKWGGQVTRRRRGPGRANGTPPWRRLLGKTLELLMWKWCILAHFCPRHTRNSVANIMPLLEKKCWLFHTHTQKKTKIKSLVWTRTETSENKLWV